MQIIFYKCYSIAMSEIILSVHVISGIMAIIASFSSIFAPLERLKSAFWPSIATVGFSGVGLMFTGASIVRVCVSGIILAGSLIVIHKYTAKKLATQRTNN
jgi:hypothetical protein